MAIAPGPRVLSIRQPWAWAIVTSRKKIENRTWTTAYRGTVFIHASSRLDRDAVKWLQAKARTRLPKVWTFGAIIAVVELSDVVQRQEGERFRTWFFGPYGLVFTKVRPLLRQIPMVGRLGLFRAPPPLVRAVNRQLPKNGL